ncbi:MAG: slipin family protein [Coriobacteriales bacterium]|jgi:regulator of protease activity HflC (stomatin/prohibitin superfamily)|nr:slipin family protein [Coriobacteriales bacterium]
MPAKDASKRAEQAEKNRPLASIDKSGVRGNRSSRNGVYFFAATVFCLVIALLLGIAYACDAMSVWLIIGAVVVAALAAFSIRIAQQWEKAVVLRLGKFHRVAGPGLYLIIPIVEHVTICIDQRIIATPFAAEETLTADLVSVDVDAVLFWMVWDARMACIEVENYPKTVAWSAQTALRDAIGRVNLAELATRRRQIDAQLQETLTAKTEPWGISIISVEIRDIIIPQELQDSMSKAAQAERERDARVLLAEVEKDISEMFVEAAEVYDQNDRAMQLRTMNLIYESVREHGGLIIAPSAFSEGFNNIEEIVKRLKS